MSDVAQGPDWWQASDGKWYPPQPAKASKKIYQRVWFWLLIFVALGFGGCIVVLGGAANEVSKQANKVHTVVFSVTGDGTADVTYDNISSSNQGTAQAGNVTLPWSKTGTSKGFLSVYSLDAQLQSGSTITCTITVDGKQIANTTSTGEFSIASCSGSA